MAQPPPIVYLLYGDDDFAMQEFVNRLRAKLGDSTTADMNTQIFFGKGLDLGAFEEACKAMPFLAPRRLVVLQQAEGLPKDKAWLERFETLLSELPSSTALIALENVNTAREKDLTHYQRTSWLFRWAQAQPTRALIRQCINPRGQAFVRWLVKRCRSMDGEITPQAAELLTEWVSEDPYLAVRELTKLLDYVDRQKPIEIHEVERLTPFQGQSDIFALVDALGQRRGQEAQRLLYRLLQEEDPLYIFSMIVRQIRLLLLAREALDNGQNPQDALPGRTPAFVVRKIRSQARNFSLPDLEAIYHKLLEIDRAAKRSDMDRATALDSLVVAVAA